LLWTNFWQTCQDKSGKGEAYVLVDKRRRASVIGMCQRCFIAAVVYRQADTAAIFRRVEKREKPMLVKKQTPRSEKLPKGG